MRQELQTLLQAMQSERNSILKKQESFGEQLRSLRETRQKMARHCVNELLPDLQAETIKALRREVPNFSIPTKSGFFSKLVSFFGGASADKIDPRVPLDLLRIHLGSYLDNSEEKPETRAKVEELDRAIHDLQTNLIKSNTERLDEISERIKALEKLQAVDQKKLNPETRDRIEEALKSQAYRFRSGFGKKQPDQRQKLVAPPYPTRPQISSDSGPSLLEMWLWYQLLMPHSEVSREIQQFEQFEPGGGLSGGAGASGEFPEKTQVSSDGSSDSSGALLAGVVAASAINERVGIEQHDDLGAKSFS